MKPALFPYLFEAIHYGDPSRIERAFDPEGRLVGHIGESPCDKGRNEYMEVLASRAAPVAAGTPFSMKIRSIDVFERAAAVRTHTPMPG